MPDRDLLAGAAAGFALALVALVLAAALIVFGGAEGRAAVEAIAGLRSGADPEMLRLAAGFDTLLPIGYTTGISLMALALSGDIKGGFVVALALLGMTADVIENGLTLAAMPVAQTATFAKFAFLSAAGVGLVTLIRVEDWLTGLARALGWGLIPLAMAAIAADLPLARDPVGFVLGLGAVFGVLLILCLRARA